MASWSEQPEKQTILSPDAQERVRQQNQVLRETRQQRSSLETESDSRARTAIAIGAAAFAAVMLAVQPVGERIYHAMNPKTKENTHIVKRPNGVAGGFELQSQTTESVKIEP